MNVEDGIRLALEARRIEEEEEHTRIEAEEEAHLVEEERLKSEEEEQNLRLKAEEEARIAEAERLKVEGCQFSECHRTMNFNYTHASLPITRAEEHKRTRLKVEVGVRLALAEK